MQLWLSNRWSVCQHSSQWRSKIVLTVKLNSKRVEVIQKGERRKGESRTSKYEMQTMLFRWERDGIQSCQSLRGRCQCGKKTVQFAGQARGPQQTSEEQTKSKSLRALTSKQRAGDDSTVLKNRDSKEDLRSSGDSTVNWLTRIVHLTNTFCWRVTGRRNTYACDVRHELHKSN